MQFVIEAASAVFSVDNLLFILIGVIIGTIFGMIPGLNTPIAVALTLPLTLSMNEFSSICLLMGIYCGGMSGGLVSAILLKIPGTAAAVATTFDGYPMTLKGEAAEALSWGVFASFFGGIFSCIFLIVLAEPLSELAVKFGPWEYFGTMVLALSLVCALAAGNLLKGLISMLLGLLLATVGQSPIDGVAQRFTFGNLELSAGFNMVILIIGLFAFPELLSVARDFTEESIPAKFRSRIFFAPKMKNIIPKIDKLGIAATIGTVIGILPGLGGGPASMTSYAVAKKVSKTPEKFGKGTIDGVIASEAANNAVVGGALIPMLSLGVPGDTVTAIIMGALTLQGIVTGPVLVLTKPVLFRGIMVAVLVANVFMFVLQAFSIKPLSKIIQIPHCYLLPIIIVFCVTGAFSINSRQFDLYSLLAFAVVGFILDKNKYPLAPMLLGFLLSGLTESYFRRSLMYYGSISECLKLKSFGTFFLVVGLSLIVISALLENKKIKVFLSNIKGKKKS